MLLPKKVPTITTEDFLPYSALGGEIEFTSPHPSVSNQDRWRARVLWVYFDGRKLFARCLTIQPLRPKRFVDHYTTFGYGWSENGQCLLRNLEFEIQLNSTRKEVRKEKNGISIEVLRMMSDIGEEIIYFSPAGNILDVKSAQTKVQNFLSTPKKPHRNGTL